MNKIVKILRTEELVLVSVFFWLAVFIPRLVSFYYRISGTEFNTVFIPWGLLLLLIALPFYFSNKKRSFLQLSLLGMGLGLAADQFTLLFTQASLPYWSFGNFTSVLIVGTSLVILLGFSMKSARFSSPGQYFHKNPRMPKVSLIIPAFNEERYLERTLASVSRQNFKDFELIVVDNNSSDNTVKIAMNFGARVIKEKRPGVSFARQSGFLQAQGEIIATTDADTFLPPDWLSTIVAEFDKNYRLAAFGGLYTLYSGPPTARFALYYFSRPAWMLDRLWEGGWSLPGVNMAVRKTSFIEVGGFNTNLEVFEDADLSQRLKKYGDVKMDPDFKVQTSGRRYKHGLMWGLAMYLPSILFRGALKARAQTPRIIPFKPFRKEQSSLGGMHIISFTATLALLFTLFYFSHPSPEKLTRVKEKIASVSEVIKEGSYDIRAFWGAGELP